jgi:hypothetical protein
MMRGLSRIRSLCGYDVPVTTRGEHLSLVAAGAEEPEDAADEWWFGCSRPIREQLSGSQLRSFGFCLGARSCVGLDTSASSAARPPPIDDNRGRKILGVGKRGQLDLDAAIPGAAGFGAVVCDWTRLAEAGYSETAGIDSLP